MKIAWEIWHKHVADAIYIRFSSLANPPFDTNFTCGVECPFPVIDPLGDITKPVSAVAVYTVTHDGRIINARLVQTN